METEIALAPELGLSPQAFADAWNEAPDCRAVARATLSRPASAQYDPALLTVTLTVLSSLALSVAGNALYDLIKEVLIGQGVRKRTEIVQVEQPDGSHLLVVTITEE
jgi:hypothetical protein